MTVADGTARTYPVDAIVVLGGRPQRLPVGLRLWQDGVARNLVVFNETGVGEGDHLYVRPDPFNTRGEARVAARMARDRGWRSLVVVTSSYHLPRARMIFRRVWNGELRMVAAPADAWRLPYDVALELAKTVYALTLRRAP